jgi:hypothetical protein
MLITAGLGGMDDLPWQRQAVCGHTNAQPTACKCEITNNYKCSTREQDLLVKQVDILDKI